MRRLIANQENQVHDISAGQIESGPDQNVDTFSGVLDAHEMTESPSPKLTPRDWQRRPNPIVVESRLTASMDGRSNKRRRFADDVEITDRVHVEEPCMTLAVFMADMQAKVLDVNNAYTKLKDTNSALEKEVAELKTSAAEGYKGVLELREQTEGYTAKVDDLEKQHAERVTELMDEHAKKLMELNVVHTRELEDFMDEHAKGVTDLQAEHAEEVKELKKKLAKYKRVVAAWNTEITLS